MLPTAAKFRLSRIVASAVVFISVVCVPSEAETRRCYWCGPLAEQVHRSQRAPPCSAPHTEITNCDPGFPYCAIVATAPPYVESRYCVKLYQDECYSLYCNSTRTWRMSCPCRGDLCNGPNTERELDAFAGLAKLVERTQHTRNRRALITMSGFINMNSNRRNVLDNTTVEESKDILNNLTENNEADVKNNEILMNGVNTTGDANVKDIDRQMYTTAAEAPPNVKSAETQIIETTIPAVVADVEHNDGEATTNCPSDITEEVIKTSDNYMNETSIQIDIPSANVESRDLKTEIILMSSETTKVLNDAKLPEISSPNVHNPDELTTQEIIRQTAIESKAIAGTTTEATKTAPIEVKNNENKMKPSEQLPTVGQPVTVRPQHNTPVTKPTPTVKPMTTIKPQNNTAVRYCSHIVTRFTFAIGLILNFI